MPAAAGNLLSSIFAGLATFFFPSRCRACGNELDGGGPRLLCPACRAVFAAPFSDGELAGCLIRSGEAPEYGRFPYDGAAGTAVRLLKFDGVRELAPLLAAGLAPLAAAAAAEYGLEIAAPVPLHPRRRRERRFNQSEELGSRVARAMKLAYEPKLLCRVRYTRPQVELKGAARLANVAGAFAATRPLAGARVLLIDDVITTGATVRECAKALREAGAVEVVAAAAARAGMES